MIKISKINFLDWSSAIIALIALFYVKSDNNFWGLYSYACFIYVYLNIKKGLRGQATLNLVAGLIGIRNFLL